MQFLKFPFLLGVVASTALVSGLSQAQTFNAQNPSHSYTTVDAYGNVVRTTVQTPLAAASSVPALIAQQGVLGGNNTSRTSISVNSGMAYPTGTYTPGGTYYPYPVYPASPYPTYPSYPYPGYGVTNNYYPAQPYSGPLAPTSFSWQKPIWITSIPLGGGTYGAPSVPPYPAPGGYYPYPAPAYPYPAPAYPGYYPAYPYGAPNYSPPVYGGTFYNGTGYGSITTQSSSNGYGVSFGSNGLSVSIGDRRAQSSTTVSGR